MTKQWTVLLACFFAARCHQVIGFSTPNNILEGRSVSTKRALSVRWDSKLFGPDEDADDAKQQKEGEALAKKFYEQLRKREEDPSTGTTTEEVLSEETVPPKKKKWTGQSPEPTRFSERNSNPGSNQGPQTPRQRMMQQEFDLVNRAEKGLAFQAVLAVCVLILYLYVGLTGGIQSGSDFDLGADDTVVEELLLPERRDVEASYWL